MSVEDLREETPSSYPDVVGKLQEYIKNVLAVHQDDKENNVERDTDLTVRVKELVLDDEGNFQFHRTSGGGVGHFGHAEVVFNDGMKTLRDADDSMQIVEKPSIVVVVSSADFNSNLPDQPEMHRADITIYTTPEHTEEMTRLGAAAEQANTEITHQGIPIPEF